MGQILVRNIDDDVHTRLKAKAAEKGQSLEAYVRDLLSETTKPSKAEVLARAAEIRKRIGPISEPPEDVIRRMRDEREEHIWKVVNDIQDHNE